MLRVVFISLFVVLFTIACSPIAPPHPTITSTGEPDGFADSYLATSLEDVVGKWNTTYHGAPMIMELREDGTWDWITSGAAHTNPGEIWFENGEYHVTDNGVEGVYEVVVHIHDGERAALSFTTIRDNFAMRSADLEAGMTRVVE